MKAESSFPEAKKNEKYSDEILSEIMKLSPNNNFAQLKDKPKRKNLIDIWWIYDDGGK